MLMSDRLLLFTVTLALVWDMTGPFMSETDIHFIIVCVPRTQL